MREVPIAPALAATIALVVLAGTRSPAGAADSPGGVADFAPIARVLQSPRCLNCHPSGDAPLIGDHGIPHPMHISRKSMEAGLLCTTCHRDTNFDRPHGPPGAPNWRLPPKETPMVFQGRSPHELCLTLKDPKQNNNRTLAQLEEHFVSDAVVAWGWAPGPGRTLPPISHEELNEHVRRWIKAGAPCP